MYNLVVFYITIFRIHRKTEAECLVFQKFEMVKMREKIVEIL